MKSMNPNDLGVLVEECQKIEINSFLRNVRSKIKKTMIESELMINGLNINLKTSKTGFGGIRYWFECPICKCRVGTLFSHPVSLKIGCRECLGLEYRQRAYKGMVENESCKNDQYEL